MPTLWVLLVEDDLNAAGLTIEYLKRDSIAVTHVTDGRAGLDEALRGKFDAILLDVGLPDVNGIEVCREIRARRDIPILMLTAEDDEAHRVGALDSGADDYVTKPYSWRELVARVRSVVRRSRRQAGPAVQIVKAGRFVIDPVTLRATKDGTPIDLTPDQFAILRAFAEAAGRVLSREELLSLAHGDPGRAFDRSIDVQVSRIRRKLGDNPRRPRFLKTVRGRGYLFAPD